LFGLLFLNVYHVSLLTTNVFFFFWDVTPCSPVEVQHFGGRLCFHFQGLHEDIKCLTDHNHTMFSYLNVLNRMRSASYLSPLTEIRIVGCVWIKTGPYLQSVTFPSAMQLYPVTPPTFFNTYHVSNTPNLDARPKSKTNADYVKKKTPWP
jgi:hypothetical protein